MNKPQNSGQHLKIFPVNLPHTNKKYFVKKARSTLHISYQHYSNIYRKVLSLNELWKDIALTSVGPGTTGQREDTVLFSRKIK